MALSDQFGWDNPFTQFIGNNRNTLMGFGAGLASGRNFGDGVAAGLQGAQQGKLTDTLFAQQEEEKAKEEQQTNVTRDWLAAQGYDDLVPLVDAGQAGLAYSEALKRMQPGYGQGDLTANQNDYQFYANQEMQAGRTPMSFAEWVQGGGGGAGQFGLTPIWGQLPDGTFAYGVQGKDGTFRQVDTGELSPLDPRTLAGERAFGTATGKASGEATAAAQGDIDAGLAALDILDQIETHPELGWATGQSVRYGGNSGWAPGTQGRYDFQNIVDQAKSGAFLIAVQQMRGLGSLSNAEGGAATQAITRMDTATSKEAFLRALSDYKAIIQRGVDRARARLGNGGQQGQNFVYNPATGQLEPQ